MNKKDALEKLVSLIIDINKLPEYHPNNNNSDFTKCKIRIERYLSKIFGENSQQVQKYRNIASYIIWRDDIESRQKAHYLSVSNTKTLLETFIEEVEEWEDLENDKSKLSNSSLTTSELNKNKVFIVHGHDKLASSEVSEVLRKLKIEPIVLHEQANQGNTIIEKIEQYTNEVGFAIVLYTECDVGGKSKDSLQPRARQNVVLEHGFLMAKLGRKNTMALKKGKVETPSDIDGIVYTPMDDNNAWKYKLADELKAASYTIDKNLI